MQCMICGKVFNEAESLCSGCNGCKSCSSNICICPNCGSEVRPNITSSSSKSKIATFLNKLHH